MKALYTFNDIEEMYVIGWLRVGPHSEKLWPRS